MRLKEDQLPVLEQRLESKNEIYTNFCFNDGIDGSTNHPGHAFKFNVKNASDQFMLATKDITGKSIQKMLFGIDSIDDWYHDW